jgi:hypothetical protein
MKRRISVVIGTPAVLRGRQQRIDAIAIAGDATTRSARRKILFAAMITQSKLNFQDRQAACTESANRTGESSSATRTLRPLTDQPPRHRDTPAEPAQAEDRHALGTKVRSHKSEVRSKRPRHVILTSAFCLMTSDLGFSVHPLSCPAPPARRSVPSHSRTHWRTEPRHAHKEYFGWPRSARPGRR